jgi:hypothetical protein
MLNKLPQPSFRGRLEATQGNFLESVGKDGNKNLAPERGIWRLAEKLGPERLEGLSTHSRQCRELIIERIFHESSQSTE